MKTRRLMELSEKYGVDPVEVQFMLMRDLKKTVDHEINKPRSRRSKQFFEAQKQLCEIAKEVAPYVHSRRAAVEVSDETPRLTVIRAPERIESSEEFLRVYGPKRDEAVNDRPAASAAVRRLEDTYRVARGLDGVDAQDILREASKKKKDGPDDDVVSRENKKFLDPYN
jgi:hypothetical protein